MKLRLLLCSLSIANCAQAVSDDHPATRSRATGGAAGALAQETGGRSGASGGGQAGGGSSTAGAAAAGGPMASGGKSNGAAGNDAAGGDALGAGVAGVAGDRGAAGATSDACQLELVADADTYILANAPAGNNGPADILAVTRWGAAASTRVLVHFDLSALTPEPVHAATLRLTIQSSSPEMKTISVHAVTAERAWTEDGVSWNDLKLGSPWSSAGGDFAAAALNAALASTRKAGDVVEWDLTAELQYYQAHPGEYSGFLLKDSQEPAQGAGEVVRFHSRESAHPPRLSIETCH